MKRRAFLRMLGLAPIVAASSSLALPKPDNPKRLADGGVVGPSRPVRVGEAPPEQVEFQRMISPSKRLEINSGGQMATISIIV